MKKLYRVLLRNGGNWKYIVAMSMGGAMVKAKRFTNMRLDPVLIEFIDYFTE